MLKKFLEEIISRHDARLPPIEKWDPPLSGNIDIVIKSNGDWFHNGAPIKRLSLIKLFSSILKKENNDYFLVSPTEKWKITVEDAPLLVIDSVMENINGLMCMAIKTKTDDQVIISTKNPLILKKNETEVRPYIYIRNNLEALVHRNVYYEWTELSVEKDGKFGIYSAGGFFPLET